MREIFWVAVVAALDQLSKAFIVSWLEYRHSVEVWKGFFRITRAHNDGGAFGIFQNNPYTGSLITVIAALISVGIVAALFAGRVQSKTMKTGLILIAGGAIGNLIDRLHYGYVIDFLEFSFWPVFNLADSAIVIGTGFVILSLLRRPPEEVSPA